MITETSKYIQESQKCQRNWNLNKNIPDKDLDLIMEAVTNCPTRQNINFYNVQAITNRDLIEKIHEHTAYFKIDPDVDVSEYSKLISQKSDIKKSDKDWVLKTNPQVLGHLLLAFSANEETYYRDAIDDKWDKDVMNSIYKDFTKARSLCVVAKDYFLDSSDLEGDEQGSAQAVGEMKKTINQLDEIFIPAVRDMMD